MENKEWQEKTNGTLKRIENGAVDNEGLSLTFREAILLSMTKIDNSLAQNEKDHTAMLPLLQKIPSIENGLNNHLHLHDQFRQYVFYPVVVAFILGLAGLFCKMVLKVF